MGPGIKRSHSFASCQPASRAYDRLYKDATDRMEKNLFAKDYNMSGKSTMTAQAYNTSLKDFHER